MKYQEFIDRSSVPSCFIGVTNTRYITEEEQLHSVEVRFMDKNGLFDLSFDIGSLAQILDRLLFMQCPRHFSTALSLDGLAIEFVFDSSREVEFTPDQSVEVVRTQLENLSKMQLVKGAEDIGDLRQASDAASYLMDKAEVITSESGISMYPDTIMLAKLITEGLATLKPRMERLTLEEKDEVVRDFLGISISEDVSKLYRIEVVCNAVTEDIIVNVASVDAEQPAIETDIVEQQSNDIEQ